MRNWGFGSGARAAAIIFVILAIALLLRIVNLEADPAALMSRDFITDEGWWAHNVRNALFYGQWRIDDYNPGLYSAGLYNALLYVCLKTCGPSLEAVRLLPALAGWLTVALLFFWVRREAGLRAAAMAALLLGFSNLHIMYSRTGFVESMLVFFLALWLWLWSLRRTHRAFAVMSGAALALLLLTKITALYFVPGILLLLVAARIRGRLDKRDMLWAMVGVAVVVALYAGLFIAPHFSEWLEFNLNIGAHHEWSEQSSGLLLAVLKFFNSRFYAEAPLVTGLTLVALGQLIVSISKQRLPRAIRAAGEIEITCVALLAGYSFALALTIYQPERRFIPALFLMTALAANVLDKGCGWFASLVKENEQMGAGAWFAILFPIPAVLILKFKWVALGSPVTVRFWLIKFTLIAGLILMAIAIGRSSRLTPYRAKLLTASKRAFILGFAVLALAVVYKALSLWGLNLGALRHPARGGSLILAIGLTLLALIAFTVVGCRARHHPAALLIAAILLIESLQITTWLLQPSYTLKEASASLVALIEPDATVISRYETVLLASSAKVICYWPAHGINVDAFERFRPAYVLILRRDDWKDYALEAMPRDEWPPPVKRPPAKITSFELCPVRGRGPRFVLELYRLNKEDKQRDTASE